MTRRQRMAAKRRKNMAHGISAQTAK